MINFQNFYEQALFFGFNMMKTSITVTTSNLSSSKKVEIFLYLTLLKTVFTASKSVSITSTPYKIFGFLKIAIKNKKTPSPQPISKTLLLLGMEWTYPWSCPRKKFL